MNYLEARDKIHAPFYNVWKDTGYPVVWEDNLAKPPSIELLGACNDCPCQRRTDITWLW